jgi:hypothetical protein
MPSHPRVYGHQCCSCACSITPASYHPVCCLTFLSTRGAALAALAPGHCRSVAGRGIMACRTTSFPDPSSAHRRWWQC